MEESSLVRRTEQLPRAIEGFPTGKRENIIHEIYQSEYTYVAGLEVLIDVSQAGIVVYCGAGIDILSLNESEQYRLMEPNGWSCLSLP